MPRDNQGEKRLLPRLSRNSLGIGFSSAKPRSIPAAILKRACLRSTAQLLDSHDVAAVLKVAEYALATGGKCALVNAS